MNNRQPVEEALRLLFLDGEAPNVTLYPLGIRSMRGLEYDDLPLSPEIVSPLVALQPEEFSPLVVTFAEIRRGFPLEISV